LISQLDIKTSGPGQVVSALSGGNQQKVVMGRALSGDPRVLVLITPTAGIDVRSKESLLAVVDEGARSGRAILMVTDDLEDLRSCDRVVVMFRGGIVAEYPSGWADHQLVAAIEGLGSRSDA
jgi:simple sugar transport system ATP-binding protein